MTVYRGQIIQAWVEGLDEPKLFLVVSNNRRNASRLGTVLAVRMTTTVKPDLPSIVVLPKHESFTGRIMCDDIEPIYDDQVIKTIGAVSPQTMALVNQALKVALDLP